MSTDRPSQTPLSPLLVMGSPRSGTTFLAHMVNRFFDIRLSRDNGTLVRFYNLLPHYEPLSDDANLRRLISNLYADHYIQERLQRRGLVLSEAQLFDRVHERTYGGLIEAMFSAIAAERGRSMWGYKRASLARMTGDSVNVLFPAREVRPHHSRRARGGVVDGQRVEDAARAHVALRRRGLGRARDPGPRGGRRRSDPDAYLELRYERLMAAPADGLVEILDFCGGGADRDDTGRAHPRRSAGAREAGQHGQVAPAAAGRRRPPDRTRRRPPAAGTGIPVDVSRGGRSADRPGRDGLSAPSARVCQCRGRAAGNLWQYRMSIFKARQRARFKRS